MISLPGAVRRSGGPKTSAGKSVSSRNAIKSGAYTQIQFLEDENPKEYEALKSAVLEDLAPQTVVQSILAQDIVSLAWKKARLERYRSYYLVLRQDDDLTRFDWKINLGENWEEVFRQAKMVDPESRDKGISYYEELLEKLNAIRSRHNIRIPDPDLLQTKYPEVYQLLRLQAEDVQEFDEVFSRGRSSNASAAYLNTPDLDYWCKLALGSELWIKTCIQAIRAEQKIAEARRKAIQKTIYHRLISGEGDRAADDLSRAWHRALSEYRREQDRYRKDTAILLEADGSEDDSAKGSSKGALALDVITQGPSSISPSSIDQPVAQGESLSVQTTEEAWAAS